MLVHVWPDKYPKSWDGVADLDNFACHASMPYTEALVAEYSTDAHFCPAILEGAEVFPRLAVKMPANFVQAVRFYTIVVDVDTHKIPGTNERYPADDEWYEAQVHRLQGTDWDGGVRYRTKGGYRLLWELPEALKTFEYLNLLAALRGALIPILSGEHSEGGSQG